MFATPSPLAPLLAQAVAQGATPAAPTLSAPNAITIFYISLIFIFLTAIVTAVVTKWSRDKCLKFFHGYHITVERLRGQTYWGRLKVFSSGVEIVYDHPYTDPHGRRKTSYMVYGGEVENQVLTVFRYHDELDEASQKQRVTQIHRTFNPGPLRRGWRGVRNFVNTLRDAFSAAIGTAVGQFQRMNPASAVLSTQAGAVTNIGQTLLGKFANAYEPLLEQYIGQTVILDVADPINPNNATVQYSGYLADYSQAYIAIFNVNHETGEAHWLTLPDIDHGDSLPPLPPPPPPGAPPPVLPPPLVTEHGLAVRIDGSRMRLTNTLHEPIVIRKLERTGFAPHEFGCVLPPSGSLDLPARDAQAGKLWIEIIRCLDVVAPRKYAVVRHAGVLTERRGLIDELQLDRLPLVPLVLGRDERDELS